jgi:hypothetical protein
MVAVSAGGTVASAWVSAPEGGIDGRLYVEVHDSSAAEIRDSLGPIEGHGESPPKLAYSAGGALNALYVVVKDVATAPAPLEALRFVRSNDSGRTWSQPVTITSDGVFGTHNFHALHVAHDGTIYASWLGGTGHATPWITHSSDGGVTWAPEVQVDSGETCDCCRTALGSASDGTLYLAWRHVYPGNMRDVVVARSTDHGATWGEPVRVHADGWSFNGCPRAGPSLQIDSLGRVHVAWWTGKSGGAGIWYARSDDSGRTFGTPIPLGVAATSRAGHVQLALGANGNVAAVWDDGTEPTPRIMFRLSHDDGQSFGPAEQLSVAGRSVAFPVIAIHDDTVTTAWTESGTATPTATTVPAPMDHHGVPTHRGIKPIGNAQVVVRRASIAR